MKFLIAGAGGVGGYVAASLARGGNDVSVLTRGEHGRIISDNGLTLEGAESHTVKLPASETAKSFAPLEIVLLATKRTDLKVVLSELMPFVGNQTIFITLQNGLDADHLCRTVFPSLPVVAGIAYIDSWIARPGVISVGTSARLALGTADEHQDLLKSIAEPFEKSGIGISIPTDFTLQRWSKFTWNIICNPLCLITRSTVGDIRTNPRLMELARKVLDELVAIAAVEGVTLPTKTIDAALGKVQPRIFNANTRTSMWADYQAGKKTEIDYLNGEISTRGKKLGIPTPFNDALVALVHALEKTRAGRV